LFDDGLEVVRAYIAAFEPKAHRLQRQLSPMNASDPSLSEGK
jgi:hypothetical protein